MHFRSYAPLLVYVLLLTAQSLTAQPLPLEREAIAGYQKATRSNTGAPGKNYWQNRGDYHIDVQFDPSSRSLDGTVDISYTNQSPDTLSRLLFRLYPNLYKDDALRNMPVASADLTHGLSIDNMQIDGNQIDSAQRPVRGTSMYIKGIKLLPGAISHIRIKYHYTINRGSFIRTGQIDSGAFFIAYFFPRVAVYDDVIGWNDYPYVGKEEFYNDYGNFDVNIRIPGNYQLWATGELQNAAEVYRPEIADRIERAQKEDSVTDIITAEDIKYDRITLANPFNTWHFSANKVTDFAFAVSNHYIWKASSIEVDPKTKRRTRVDAVFNPAHRSYLPVIAYNRRTVELISYHFPALPFPYSHETIIDGLDAMEYPMMVNNLPFEDPKDVVEFTAHEVFHSIFPFYVGTNESRNSFMDEGWATLTEFWFHPLITPDIPLDYDLSPVNDYAGSAEDMPVMTPTPQLYGKARFADKDLKPALALYYLKEMLGEKDFITATQAYIRQWQGKHPTPYDFFNSINRFTRQDLNWFWRSWYFEKATPDLKIAEVKNDNGNNYTITIANAGGTPMPVHLKLLLADDSSQIISKNISIWADGKKTLKLPVKTRSKLKKVLLGTAYDADIHPDNNVWTSRDNRTTHP